MEHKTDAVVQDLAHLTAVVRTFFDRRRIFAIDGRTAPSNERMRMIQRHWTDGRCVFYGQNSAASIQWMRANIPFSALIDETCDLIVLLMGQPSIRRITYFEAFQKYAGIDPFTDQDCSAAAIRLGLNLDADCEDWDRNTWLRFLFKEAVQPHLGHNELTVVTDFLSSLLPEDRALEKEKDLVAEHFEIYLERHELAIGRATARKGIHQKKEFYALNEEFLAALQITTPDLLSVTLMLDRLIQH